MRSIISLFLFTLLTTSVFASDSGSLKKIIILLTPPVMENSNPVLKKELLKSVLRKFIGHSGYKLLLATGGSQLGPNRISLKIKIFGKSDNYSVKIIWKNLESNKQKSKILKDLTRQNILYKFSKSLAVPLVFQ